MAWYVKGIAITKFAYTMVSNPTFHILILSIRYSDVYIVVWPKDFFLFLNRKIDCGQYYTVHTEILIQFVAASGYPKQSWGGSSRKTSGWHL